MALHAVKRLHKRHQNMPILDLKAKKADINFLMDQLSKDSKESCVTDTSNRPGILDEITSSLTDWLNDIWSVVYEHSVNFSLAHECLLFVCDTLNRLDNVRSW